MSYQLAADIPDIDAYFAAHGNERKVMALDTEYTNLNLVENRLTGISISVQPETGLYMPIGHKVGDNLNGALVAQRLHAFLERSGYMTTYFNAISDRTMTLKAINWAPVLFRDVQQAAYLGNCERQNRDLKTLASEDVGFHMARFESLFTGEERKASHLDISTKPAFRCVAYACADADGTLRLDEHYEFVWQRHPTAIKIDTALIDIVAEMQFEGGMVLNEKYIREQLIALEWRGRALEAVIHRIAGRKFDIGSPKVLSKLLFDEMAIPHPLEEKFQKGKSGQWTTNAEALDKLSETHPIAELIINYRKVSTALSGPLGKLKYLLDHDLSPRFRLNMNQARTFRFSAPGGNPNPNKKKWDGHSGCNAQAIGKGTIRDINGVDLSAIGSAREYIEDFLEDGDELLVDLEEEFGSAAGDPGLIKTLTDVEHTELLTTLPYVVETDRADDDGNSFTGLACFRDHCRNCTAMCESRGIDVTRRKVKAAKLVPPIRAAFMAPEGYSLVSMDYDGQEIVIAANLSGEPTWINALLGETKLERDLHAQTAMKVFGHTPEEWVALAEHIIKYERETGKRLNFGTLFGAVAATLSRRMGIPLSKAEEIWEDYRRGLPTLFRWISDTIINARAVGYTQTYLLGRRRPLAHYWANRSRKLQGFADRAAVNTWIQGTGADATRIAMARQGARLRKEQIDREICRFGLQIHDELMYIVRDRELDQVLPILKHEMEFKVKPWAVQLTTGVKVGRIWGRQENWKLAA